MNTEMKPRIAFLGATGGCTLACLAPALEAGYPCVALVRTPDKLTNLLTTRNLPASALANLSIIRGSSTDPSALADLLTPLPALIISGVGGAMSFSNPLKPTLDNPTICQDTMRALLSTTASLTRGLPLYQKPFLATISTTGISDGKQDVPCAMKPFYHWVLKEPHADKKTMERAILDEAAKGEGERAFRNWVAIRPSFLTNGKALWPEVRVGSDSGELQGGDSPPVGYTISREDVGLFMFHGIVEKVDEKNPYWGEFVGVTH